MIIASSYCHIHEETELQTKTYVNYRIMNVLVFFPQYCTITQPLSISFATQLMTEGLDGQIDTIAALIK